jgi:hypothetical protein
VLINFAVLSLPLGLIVRNLQRASWLKDVKRKFTQRVFSAREPAGGDSFPRGSARAAAGRAGSEVASMAARTGTVPVPPARRSHDAADGTASGDEDMTARCQTAPADHPAEALPPMARLCFNSSHSHTGPTTQHTAAPPERLTRH